MNDSLSPNTRAILLLTAPLIVAGGRRSPPSDWKPLSLKREYSSLARRLRRIGREPADLLSADRYAVIEEAVSRMDPGIDPVRLDRLLGRGMQLSLAVERWAARAIWIVSRADADYPRRLKRRLGERAPAVLYGCGDRSFCDAGGLAIVGSRSAREEALEAARHVGELAAGAGRAVISGGARGVDAAAMQGALAAGGRSVGVLANGLARAATNREYRQPLLDGKLLLISPYDPAAGFFAGHAMERNHHVYSLADAALVVASARGNGGTWSGAVDALRKGAVPVYVRADRGGSEGLAALRRRGARLWPDPGDAGALSALIDSETESEPAIQCREDSVGRGDSQPDLLAGAVSMSAADTAMRITTALAQLAATPAAVSARGAVRYVLRSEDRPEFESESEAETAGQRQVREPWGAAEGERDESAAERLDRTARHLSLRLLEQPMTATELASGLGVTRVQAREWLLALEERDEVKRLRSPVRYVARQIGLLGFGAASARSKPGTEAAPELRRSFLAAARPLLRRPMRPVDVASELGTTKGQTERWLRQLADEGELERIARTRPARPGD